MNYKNWEPLSLHETCNLLKDLNIPWYIAGGYAIELFVGNSFRNHEDIDVLIQRKDQLIVQKHLNSWKLWRATLPGLKLWESGEYLKGKFKDIWCRPHEESPWKLQIMLFDTEEELWIYKRDPKIRGALSDMYKITRGGIRYLAPEIQLLYKSKDIREKDQLDFDQVLPLLDFASKHWLFSCLCDQYPQGHPWIDELRQSIAMDSLSDK